MAVNQQASEQLARIKKNISTWHTYFNENYKRYREFRRYAFRETISEQQRAVLNQLKRPVVEFNVVEAFISRLLGEFSMQEPSIEASPSDGTQIDTKIIDLVEGHLRHILYEADKSSFSYEVYKDLLSGGFSSAKVYTDYENAMSFKQQIYLKRVFDPTLIGYDPMARDSHKGDGNYCFEVVPMTEEDFHRTHPEVALSAVGYVRDFEEFNWSFKDQQDNKIVLLVDYYEKKKRRTQIVELSDGQTMTKKNYERFLKIWDEQGFIEQPPMIVGKPRWTELEIICRYRLIETEVLEYEETDYAYLPYVFIDGNSILLTLGTSNNTYQMTRPYIYNAKGIQDLTNLAGITVGNSMENLIQHKFIIMKEAIPQEQDYLEALNDIQRANTVVVNAYSENNPDKPIPTPIREVQNIPLPPEVLSTFQLSGPLTQTILGSFSSNIGKKAQNLSGKAVIESATQDNAASMPYVVGYLAGLTQIGNIIVDLIPKYLTGKRKLPVVNMGGKKDYADINGPGMPAVDYQQGALKVNISAGVNFQVQKNQALEQIVALMQASQEFNQFMNSPTGLPILVKNLTIYGADELQEAIPQWIQQQQQQQQQAMQMQQQAMQSNPQMIRAQAEMMKVQQAGEQNQIENQIEIARVAVEKELADAKILEAESKVTQAQIDSAVRIEEANTSLEVHSLDAATKMAEIQSRQHEQSMDRQRHVLDIAKHEHEKLKSSKESSSNE